MADKLTDKNSVTKPLTTSSNIDNSNENIILKNNTSNDNLINENSSKDILNETNEILENKNLQIKSILKNKNETKPEIQQKDQSKLSQIGGGILKGILKIKKKTSIHNNNNNNNNNINSNNNNNCITVLNDNLIEENLNSKKNESNKDEIKTEILQSNDNLNNQNCRNNETPLASPLIQNQTSLFPQITEADVVDNKAMQQSETVATISEANLILSKPPLPPSKIPTMNKQFSSQLNINNNLPSLSSEILQSIKVPPPRLKRKLDEQQQNSAMIQKLNACTEQLRLEISDLKTALGNERNAVRLLRAQYEAETRKSKTEIKKLQAALEISKKAAIASAANTKKFKEDLNLIKDSSGDHSKLIQEISNLRESNKILEEKIQILNDAERRKNADIRELKDSYEIRLTQISKSAKTEINRLLEEIKTKERNIGHLKKEINSLKHTITTNKKDIKRNAQHPPEMKKLKDVERLNGTNNNSNQKYNTTTCGQNYFHNTPHESTERILESDSDIHIFRNKDAINSSDTDSALSSAPQSISPQPPSSSTSSTIVTNNGTMTAMDSSDIWQSVKNYTKKIDTLQKNNETLQKENEKLKKELDTAIQQINELKKTVFEANNNNSKIQQLTERIRYLEHKEDEFIKESLELKEQNELLEFRILELEESHEKWSLRSNSNPDTRDMWTDTDQKLNHNNNHNHHNNHNNDHDIIMYSSDHTDSGVTSPHSQHHIDDRNVISPCDLSLMDNSANDEIKRRLAEMTKRPYIGEDDKICLLQVLTLINNLETLSEDSILVNDEMISLDLTKSKASDYSSDSSSPRSLSTDISQSLSLNKIVKTNISQQQQQHQQQQNNRIVATVLPYSSTLSTPIDSPKKIRNWSSISLQESGVFEGDNLDGYTYSQGTQTEAEDFINCTSSIASTNTPTADLCAEIQKLNKFREKIEECTTKSLQQQNQQPTPVRVSKTILSPNLSDERRLQYYKDRLELLENKLLIYESSGDQQTKRLAERLQREIKLEALVKELQEKVESLEVENLRLEEEKCEFEEAENDTRLRLQRLEIDLEILNQRNSELEMSKEAVQNKLKDARNQCSTLQEAVKEKQEKMKQLEDDSKELRNRINLIRTSMPAILLFNTLMVNSDYKTNNNGECFDIKDNNIVDSYQTALMSKKCLCNEDSKETSGNSCFYLENKVQELMTREKQLTESITELNRAYHETLENADNLWVQIEKEYKDRLITAEATENQLKAKIVQLEERLSYNSQCAQERITQLEESEQNLQHRITKLIKENKDLTLEYENAIKQCTSLKEEIANLKVYISGPVQDNMDKEKQRIRGLEEDLNASNKLLAEVENSYKNKLQTITSELQQTNKELIHIEVTNSELREEVTTLEKQIVELQNQKSIDDEKIRNLTDELRTKEEILMKYELLHNMNYTPIPSLAQEMESNKITQVIGDSHSSTLCTTPPPPIFTSEEEDNKHFLTNELVLVQRKLQTALDKVEGKINPTQYKNVRIIENI